MPLPVLICVDFSFSAADIAAAACARTRIFSAAWRRSSICRFFSSAAFFLASSARRFISIAAAFFSASSCIRLSLASTFNLRMRSSALVFLVSASSLGSDILGSSNFGNSNFGAATFDISVFFGAASGVTEGVSFVAATSA